MHQNVIEAKIQIHSWSCFSDLGHTTPRLTMKKHFIILYTILSLDTKVASVLKLG